MIDLKTVSQLSKKLQIDKYTIYREYIQIAFLNLFYQQKHKNIFFKGGTALRLMHNSKRFSEDLDFNITPKNQSKIKNILSQTINKLKLQIPNIKLKPLKSITGISYKIYVDINIANQPLTIKLDFSSRDKTKNWIQKPIETEFPATSFTLIQSQSKQEILAEKIHALYFRAKGRDIYDIWYLLHLNTPLNIKLVNYKLKKDNTKFDKNTVMKKIKQFNPKKLKQDLNNFLPLSQRLLIPQLPSLILEKLNL